jgi:hypothetical protein
MSYADEPRPIQPHWQTSACAREWGVSLRRVARGPSRPPPPMSVSLTNGFLETRRCVRLAITEDSAEPKRFLQETEFPWQTILTRAA